MKDLYAIGVYTTQMMAFQVSSYQLNLSITEITEEMVRESRQARAKKQVVEAVLEPVVSDEDVDPMQQLADIVEGQERQITELGKAIIGLDAKLNEANAEVLRLLAERQELDAENKQLREQVKQHGEQADAYYGSVLTLFGAGWDQGRYRFAADGTLQPRWSESCQAD
jgi:endo-1,4-beta-D-glucanase Y